MNAPPALCYIKPQPIHWWLLISNVNNFLTECKMSKILSNWRISEATTQLFRTEVQELCVYVCVCARLRGLRHVSCLRWGCVANTLPRGDLLWPLSARLWGRLLAPPGMQMNGHKREADTATETMEEKKGEMGPLGESGGGGGGRWGGGGGVSTHSSERTSSSMHRGDGETEEVSLQWWKEKFQTIFFYFLVCVCVCVFFSPCAESRLYWLNT